MIAQTCIRCGTTATIFNNIADPAVIICKSAGCGHKRRVPPHREPRAVTIPAGRDCQYLNVCHYAIAHGCIQPQLRDRDFECVMARLYEPAKEAA